MCDYWRTVNVHAPYIAVDAAKASSFTATEYVARVDEASIPVRAGRFDNNKQVTFHSACNLQSILCPTHTDIHLTWVLG